MNVVPLYAACPKPAHDTAVHKALTPGKSALPLSGGAPVWFLKMKPRDPETTQSQEFARAILIIASKADHTAFSLLFAHFAPRIKSFLMRSGTPPVQAEELAQEAMLSVWRKAALFDPAKASPSTWIFAIARNLRIDLARREQRDRRYQPDASDIRDDEPSAAETHANAQDEARLRMALSRLPKEQARVIELSFFGDKAHGLIAQELNIPLGTVKSRLRLALASLRKQMDGLQ